MLEKNITKEELWDYLFNKKTIDMGSYGIVKKIDEDTCVKIYYKDIFDAYASKDINKLDYLIECQLSVQKTLLEISSDCKEVEEMTRKKLELLSEIGYINKVLYYKGYKIGIEMNIHKNYIKLHKAINKLSKDEKEIITQKIDNKLDELINNNIFPIDLSSSNILINLETLDVVLIDLDDIWTRYESDEYFEEKPLIKEGLLKNCNDRLNKTKELFNKKKI